MIIIIYKANKASGARLSALRLTSCVETGSLALRRREHQEGHDRQRKHTLGRCPCSLKQGTSKWRVKKFGESLQDEAGGGSRLVIAEPPAAELMGHRE